MSGDGISLRCKLTGDVFADAWHAIKVPDGVRERLVAQSLLILTVRQKLAFERAPLHGLILLIGPPGTGKTTLARGLAYQIARHLPRTTTTFIQIDPHALASAALGSSQKAVTKLFEQTLPEAALGGVAIVLLDELETLAADRQKLSLEANPVDVHRATDAVLTGLDNLITDELPAERPFILEGCGPQLRIYCRFASKAMEGDDAIDPLTWNPTAGDWTLHVPCDAENLGWVQSALKASAPRIKAFDISEADRFEEDAEAKPSSKHAAGEIVVDWNVKE